MTGAISAVLSADSLAQVSCARLYSNIIVAQDSELTEKPKSNPTYSALTFRVVVIPCFSFVAVVLKGGRGRFVPTVF